MLNSSMKEGDDFLSVIDLLYTASLPDSDSPQVRAAMEDLSGCYETLTQTLGLAFADTLWEKECAAWGLEAEEAFARGLRLGIRLMWEVLSPADAPDTRRRSFSGQ